jgi:hypothetical protein
LLQPLGDFIAYAREKQEPVGSWNFISKSMHQCPWTNHIVLPT